MSEAMTERRRKLAVPIDLDAPFSKWPLTESMIFLKIVFLYIILYLIMFVIIQMKIFYDWL